MCALILRELYQIFTACLFKGSQKTILFPSNTLIYGISRDGSKNFNLRTWEHMILGQLRIGARSTTYAALLWHTLAYSGILWHALAYSCILWHTLAYSGILWHTLVYSGIHWHTLAYSGI